MSNVTINKNLGNSGSSNDILTKLAKMLKNPFLKMSFRPTDSPCYERYAFQRYLSREL